MDTDPEDEDDEGEVKEEKDDTGVAKRSKGIEKIEKITDAAEKEKKEKDKERRRKSYALLKEISAVQAVPKLKSLKKNRRAKVIQDATSFNWHLPIYTTQPFPKVKTGEEKRKRKREDPARFVLQIKPSVEAGTCLLDECVFEDVRGMQVSLLPPLPFPSA